MNTATEHRWVSCAAFLVLLLAIGMTGLACKQATDTPPAQQGASQPAVVYTCSMHPQIREAKPGKCPICGMALIQKK